MAGRRPADHRRPEGRRRREGQEGESQGEEGRAMTRPARSRLESQPQHPRPEPLVGFKHPGGREGGVDLGPRGPAESTEPVGVGGGLEQGSGVRALGVSRAGRASRSARGRPGPRSPRPPCPTTASRAAIASSTTFGIPSQSEGRTSRSARLEQARHVVAAAEPVDSAPRRAGRPRSDASSRWPLGAVADEDEVPVEAWHRDHLRAAASSRTSAPSAGRAGRRRGRGRHRAGCRARPGRRARRSVEGGGVDPVGDHDQAIGVEPTRPRR